MNIDLQIASIFLLIAAAILKGILGRKASLGVIPLGCVIAIGAVAHVLAPHGTFGFQLLALLPMIAAKNLSHSRLRHLQRLGELGFFLVLVFALTPSLYFFILQAALFLRLLRELALQVSELKTQKELLTRKLEREASEAHNEKILRADS